MKMKVMAMLLAVAMVACLIPFTASAAGTNYVYYVSATGSSTNDGLTEATPFFGLASAISAIKALPLTAEDTVTVKIIGAVGESSKGNASGDYYYTGQVFLGSRSNASIPVPITFEGTTADSTILLVNTGAAATGWRRYTGNYNVTFKNLTFATPDYFGGASNGSGSSTAGCDEYMYLTAGGGDITYDNVKFADKAYKTDNTTQQQYDALPQVKWMLGATGIPRSCYTEDPDFTAMPDGVCDVTRTVTFLNGDYTKVYEIAANESFDKASGYDKVDTAKAENMGVEYSVNSGAKKLNVHINLVIGAGAKVKTVSATNWKHNYATTTLTVKAGAEVENAYVFGKDAKGGTLESVVTLIVEDGATVQNATTYADGITQTSNAATGVLKVGGKTYENGVELGANTPTADTSAVVFFSALALISLAGVVVLKKQSVR